ncbi:MAG: sigma-70 family RNA polymerase sigma factor [Saprospiraceae bacterium]
MSEDEAIKGTITGLRSAQLFLYNTYRTKWYMICLRYMANKSDADDALQNGLLNIFLKITQFDSRFGTFAAWSSRIIVNDCIMLIRKNQRSLVTTAWSEEAIIYDEAESTIDILSRKELMGMIRKLPDGYRTVFNMYVIEGYSHKEIAEYLSISENTSKSQLFKAKKMLKQVLEIII